MRESFFASYCKHWGISEKASVTYTRDDLLSLFLSQKPSLWLPCVYTRSSVLFTTSANSISKSQLRRQASGQRARLNGRDASMAVANCLFFCRMGSLFQALAVGQFVCTVQSMELWMSAVLFTLSYRVADGWLATRLLSIGQKDMVLHRFCL